MNLCPSPYIGWDPGMWRERNEEKLLQGKETKPTSHEQRAGFFLVQTQGKRIEQHGRRDTEAHNILAHVTSY